MPAILFDFNGVIVNDEPQHCDALIATLAEYGIELDRERYYQEYLGFDDRECFRFTFTRHVRAAEAEGHTLAVVSGALRREIDLVLGVAGIREHFVHITAAEDVAACKPDPQ